MSGRSPRVSEALPLETIACPLCGEARFQPLFSQRDLALGVPGRFHAARCPACGLVYQNPRVRADRLADCYPPSYPAHVRDPDISGLPPRLNPATRTALAQRLGYRHLPPVSLGWRDRLQAALRGRRFVNAFPPFLGGGRLLDVGCATGRFLSLMSALGWETSGIEADPEAAAKARQVTPRIFVGDPTEATFPDQSFDVITGFHVLEHLPNPLAALQNMLRWLAVGGLLIIEVPNVAGLGGRLFGRYWSGLDFPRHLVHFAPATLTAMVEKAGGRVVRAVHRTKPRYLIRSLRHRFRDRDGPGSRVGLAVVTSRPGSGILKVILEILMPLARPLRRGEAVRYFIRRSGESSAWYDAP